MSADNGLVVRQRGSGFYVAECNASSGSEHFLGTFPNLDSATRFASHYQQEHVVEYGISFDLRATEDRGGGGE